MILLDAFYHTIEFYVLAAVVAAAVVGFCARPSGRGAVTTHLLAGQLFADSDSASFLMVECLDDGNVLLARHGVDFVGLEGAVSLAVEVKGFDLLVRERLVPGSIGSDQRIGALFTLSFLGRERYHIRYESDDTGYFTAFTLMNTPGVKIARELKT